MTMTDQASPPRAIKPIFGYQTRLLQRTSSTSTNHRTTPGSTSSGISSLSALADSSPPSSPIRKSVARMAKVSGPESFSMSGASDLPRSGSGRGSGLGLGMGGRSDSSHARGSKSIDSVRGQWEAKINDANAMESMPSTPRSSSKRSSMFSPPLHSASSLSTTVATPVSSYSAPIIPDQTGSSPVTTSTADSFATDHINGAGDSSSPYVLGRTAKRNTLSDYSDLKLSSTGRDAADAARGDTIRPRPVSISSNVSLLSPDTTGASSVASGRSQAVDDTLAVARANALRRAEARRRAKLAAAGQIEPPADDLGGPASTTASIAPRTPLATSPERSPTKVSPFGNLFVPPANSAATDITPTKTTASLYGNQSPTPASSRVSYKSVVTPPSAASMVSRYIPSGLSSASTPQSSSSGSSSAAAGMGGNDKYGSISKTDRRRLGRHLPRIASGEGGWEAEEGEHLPASSGQRQPSSLGKNSVAVNSTNKTPSKPEPSTTPSSRPRALEVLAPSAVENQQPAAPAVPFALSNKRRSVYTPVPPKVGLQSPRPEVAGDEMKGLMNAVGSLAARGAAKDEGEGVTGMSNRLRLSRSVLPPSASSASVAPAPLPSRRLMQTNWMDRQRHALAAYEYLCHVGEAQQWIEGRLGEELGFGVTEMEEGMQDGVVLAKLAREFQGEAVVKKIWMEKKFKYKQTDNINAFISFLKTVGMPHTFVFDPIDLYERKNIPKVIFCLHVLSHLLAQQGLAPRISNLVGHFDFTDEQLAKTQKGLQGVSMPNFGDARKTLAKEASWTEPEEPEETEDERRDRELLECETSITELQRHLRGRLARMRVSRIQAKLELAEPIIARFQARSRGALCRRTLLADRDERVELDGWALGLQATVKGNMARGRYKTQVAVIHSSEQAVASLQAQARGMLARVERSRLNNVLDKAHRPIVGVQAMCRGCLARRKRQQYRKLLVEPQTITAVTTFQAALRGQIHRQRAAEQQKALLGETATFTFLQSRLRGALVRRSRRAHEEKLDDANDYIVAIQTSARSVLARRKKRAFTEHIQQTMPTISTLQAVARGRLAKQAHKNMQKALAKVEVAGSVGGLQAFLRTKLAKKQTTEQKKKLEFVQPDVIGFQAVARGYLARQEYREWRDYLQDPHTQGALVFLQSLVRGFLARRRLWVRTRYIHGNVDKVVKVQALWRGRVQRQMYDRLVTGMDVDVATIQHYMHLLDDTEADYQRQIHTENLRREVVGLIRENQSLETEVKELDTKIALILKNKMTFEELARVKHSRHNHDAARDGQMDSFQHSGNRDPFTTGPHLDRASQRKLELFEHLFFTLQTKAEYLSRLLFALSRNEDLDKDRRVVEEVTLILFGFGQERREDYLFHKLLQLAVHEEVLRSKVLGDLANARFAITSVALQYIRQPITPFIQDTFTDHILRVVQAEGLDLSTDPVEIYCRLINEEESQTGAPSQKDRNLDGNQVLQIDETARALYIQHLQELRYLTKEVLETLYRSAGQLPYSVRLMARESLLALRVRYREATDEELTPIVAKTAVLPFLLPALIAPETYGIAQQAIGPVERRNLAAISMLIGCVAAQDFSESVKDWFIRTPLQQFIRAEGAAFRDWISDVASVDPLEAHFQAHELFESTSEAKPIMITRNEVYGMLGVMMRQLPMLTAGKQKDPVGAVLEELEGPPVDYDKSKTTVSLRLTNRLAELQQNGAEAALKEDWVHAKRHVLAVLRIQNGGTLYDVLVSRPEEVHEQLWLQEVYRDMELDSAKKAKHDLPPTPGEAGYQIESIRSLPFHEVKSRAIEFCMKLERAGKISRNDAFQGLLVSIAADIRQKHYFRKTQRQEAVGMEQAHDDVTKKHRGFEEQIKSYHQFIDSSMASLQKGKKKTTFLSKQYFHQRSEAKSGKKARFGSFKYTAHDLYTRGILLGISQLSPTQFPEVSIVIASNEVGVFSLELGSTIVTLSTGVMGREEVRMEDLLQAQFENELNLKMFDGMATFSINMLIHQINRKFYSS